MFATKCSGMVIPEVEQLCAHHRLASLAARFARQGLQASVPEWPFRVSNKNAQHHELASLAARFARKCSHKSVPEWSFREKASEESPGMCIPGDDWRLRTRGAGVAQRPQRRGARGV